jgi:hypothetical protein
VSDSIIVKGSGLALEFVFELLKFLFVLLALSHQELFLEFEGSDCAVVSCEFLLLLFEHNLLLIILV